MLRVMKQSPSSVAGVEAASWKTLLRELVLLSLPLMLEHFLHIGVGLTDTYLANQLSPEAGAAIGSVTYLTWFLGLMTGAIGTGSTALISRATGARDRRTANHVLGQSLLLAFVVGCLLAIAVFAFAGPIAEAFGLPDAGATQRIERYLRIFALGVPFATVTFIANACLRGAGDTLTPAIAMVVIDTANILVSFALTFGLGPVPALGFDGIAWGTSVAYIGGTGVVAYVVLRGVRRGRGRGVRLRLRRLSPQPDIIRRILKIGLPSAGEGLIHWGANFFVLFSVNTLGVASAAAHGVTVRLESLSYMTGFAVATAVATMVGQSLGMADPSRARRCGYLAYALGGGIMIVAGIGFMLFNEPMARVMTDQPAVADLAARALFITGFSQAGFAAYMIFSGALRGAGDTVWVMILNLASSLFVRLVGVVIVVHVLDLGLTAVWVVLSGELCVRGLLQFSRFRFGKWEKTQV